jgi:cbb3-type cytochrome oxidase subunit 3
MMIKYIVVLALLLFFIGYCNYIHIKRVSRNLHANLRFKNILK